jgi:RHS repeat-associated protein
MVKSKNSPAAAKLSATYSAMNQSIALPNPAVEGGVDTLPFENNLYDAYFYHSDHLGSSNYISNNTGIVSQHTEYLPFGETFVDEHLNSHNTPFKFNAKEFDDETGNYYYGARYYNPKWNVWLSVDPLVEKYPEISPYIYCANNPIIYVDPDGRDFEIFYTDSKGNEQSFIFNGNNQADAPENEFVKNVIDAYIYNKENGGGESLITIAENPFVKVGIVEQKLDSKDGSDIYSKYEGSKAGNYNFISWNPKLGLETDLGYILSPATVLEHEAAHGLGFINGLMGSINMGSDSQYDTSEERRVITGAEQKTAFANGEIPRFAVTRKNHKGLPVITESVTSNKVKKNETYQFHESRKFKNENRTPDYRKYKPKR